MRKVFLLFLHFPLTVIFTGCSTEGHFRVPENSELYIYKRPKPVVLNYGVVKTRPFFWTAAGVPPRGGIPYKLTDKEGKVIREGRLRAKFRTVSIFWPPFAIIYWPMGLNPNITYDLINDTQE